MNVAVLLVALEHWLGPLPPTTVTVAESAQYHGRAVKGAITVEPNASDFVVAHELCHQAFVEPTWQTEGLCQQVAGLVTHTEPWNALWKAYLDGGGHELPLDSPRWPDEKTRVAHLYGKAPQHFEALRKKLGDERYAAQLREFVKRRCTDCEFEPEAKKSCGCGSASGVAFLALLTRPGGRGRPSLRRSPRAARAAS